MHLIDRLTLLSTLDAIAVSYLFLAWMGIGLLIEHPGRKRPSVTVLMAEFRRDWMREMITRDPRIFDAQILGSLRQGTSFFASSSLIAVGGVLAVIGNSDQLLGVASELTLAEMPTVIWQIKLICVVLVLTNAFLKFVWANRVFGYCSVVMAAVPNDITNDMAAPRAAQAAELNIRAAWNFNRGLRSIYFALGTLAWLLGPIALIFSTTVVLYVLWEREFASLPRKILTEPPLPKA